jgi:hypothetical protein
MESARTRGSRSKAAAAPVDQNPEAFYEIMQGSVLRQEERVGELEKDFSAMGTRLANIENHNATMARGQELLFAKLDSVGQSVAGMKSSTGRISGNLILAIVATFAPLIGAAGILGHVFLSQATDSLTRADANIRDTNAQQFLALTQTITRFEADAIAQRDELVENRIEVARLQEREAAALRDRDRLWQISEFMAQTSKDERRQSAHPGGSSPSSIPPLLIP